MFDTMTLTKIIGGFCGAFLIFLLGGFFAEFIYHAPSGHGDDHHQAYMIDTGGDDQAGEDDAPAVPFAEVYASADAAAGEKLFRQCKACHSVEDGKNGTGPTLFGVVDRAVGAVGGYSYSGNLVAVADTWSPENLSGFLENPKSFAPGTKMTYKGLSDVEDRANLIAWLNGIK